MAKAMQQTAGGVLQQPSAAVNKEFYVHCGFEPHFIVVEHFGGEKRLVWDVATGKCRYMHHKDSTNSADVTDGIKDVDDRGFVLGKNSNVVKVNSARIYWRALRFDTDEFEEVKLADVSVTYKDPRDGNAYGGPAKDWSDNDPDHGIDYAKRGQVYIKD